MTRGTFYLIAGEKIISSCEFNGDMYGSPRDPKILQIAGHYREAIERLKRVNSIEDFKKEIAEFDKKNFGYQFEMINLNGQLRNSGYFRFYEHSLKDYLNEKGEIDMTDYFKLFFSDYIYLKNYNRDLKIRDRDGNKLNLTPGQIATFYFGRLIEIIEGAVSN